MQKQIEILKTVQASPNGIRTELYQAGEVYAVGSPKMPEPLAKVFLKEKWAVGVPDKEEEDQGNEGGANENKDAGASPENKQDGQKKKD